MTTNQLLVESESKMSVLSRRCRLAAGQPIGKLMAQALRYPELISLAAGFVDNATLPTEAVRHATDRLAHDKTQLTRSLQYDATAGNLGTRTSIAEWSHREFPNSKPEAERLILTAGSNQFLHLIAEAICDPGDIVIAAAPTYFVFLGTLRGIGARVFGVDADEDGICMDALEEQLNRIAASGDAGRVKAIYTVTEFDNPASSTLSLQRRERLLEIVERWRKEHGPILVLSDNAYQELRYSGQPLPPLTAIHSDARNYVVELGTFSKSFSPGMRVGWGVVPQAMVEPLLDLKSSMDFGSPHFNQMLVREVITSGALDSHLPIIRAAYEIKLNAMLEALESEFGSCDEVRWRKPDGGLYVWLELPDSIDASESGELWKAATECGVLYVPGHYCFPGEGRPIQKNTIRLSFGVQDESTIRSGIQKLAAAFRAVTTAT